MKVYYPERHELHSLKGYYMEGPQRIDYILQSMSGWKEYEIIPVNDIVEKPIIKVHGDDYLKKLSIMGEAGMIHEVSTYVVPGSIEAVKNAVATALKAAESAIKDGISFGAIRPPGHHASPDGPAGFCLVNNAAIVAEYLMSSGHDRIAILDLDAHAGDGTMSMFYERDDILLISLHEDPHYAYPHRGFSKELGHGKGYGYTVNVELPGGLTSKPYNLIIEKLALPLMKWYDPDVVILSLGFDTFYMDRASNISIPLQGYYYMGQIVSRINKPVVALLEGGYTPAIGECAISFFSGFLGLHSAEIFPSVDISYRITSKSSGKKFAENIIHERQEVLEDIHGFRFSDYI